MWALPSYVSNVVAIPKPTKQPLRTLPRLVVSVSATKQNDSDSDMGALGRTILTALESGSTANCPEEDEKSKPTVTQISGSDVLWAVKKVAEKKTKRKRKRREVLSSMGGRREESGGIGDDYKSDDGGDGGLRPLVVKSEWPVKLDELEKRLSQLCDTK